MINLDSILKSRDITFSTKVHLFKAMVYSVVMNGCESWTIKRAEHQKIDAFKPWCWRRLLRVLWTTRRSIQSIHAEAETPILWPPEAKIWLIGKYPDAEKDWGQKEKGTTEDEMVGWHHWHNGHGFGWTPGVGDGHGSLLYCGSWGHKESDMTEWLNWTELDCPALIFLVTYYMLSKCSFRQLYSGGTSLIIIWFHSCIYWKFIAYFIYLSLFYLQSKF